MTSAPPPPLEPSAPADRPLRRDARLNRERILCAAGETFAVQGLGASLEEVARRAGVGIGTLYRHFPNREALADALFETRTEHLAEVAEEALAREDAWEGLVHFLERAFEVQSSDCGLKEALAGTLPGAARVRAAADRIQPLMRRLIDRAHEQGSLRPDVAYEDIALLHWANSGITNATASVAPDLWRRHLALMLDAMRARPSEPLPVPPLTPEQLARATGRGDEWPEDSCE